MNKLYTTPNCFRQSSGKISLTTSGVGPFGYSWSPGGYTTPIVNGLSAGIYSITITDGNGCQTFTSVNLPQPSPLSLNISPSQTICYGTNANVYGFASGGTIPYTYTLTDVTNSAISVLTTSNGITMLSNNLTATTLYTISVVDSGGCINGPNTSVVNVSPPLIVTGANYTVCETNTISLTPTFIGVGNRRTIFL